MTTIFREGLTGRSGRQNRPSRKIPLSTPWIPVEPVWFPRLAYGTEAERANFQIAGAGYGIHRPDLDEDYWRGRVIFGETIFGK